MLNNKALAASLSAGPKTYIEDVFSTWLYTGNGGTQTITNGIDLSGKGGLVWIKHRSGTLSGVQHALYDTQRGANKTLQSSGTQAQLTTADTLTAFNSTGFTLGADATYGTVNFNASQNYTSWTFRKAPKFFDVVTYTGNGGTQTINHSLGSVPGCIIVKSLSTANWIVYHRSRGNSYFILLNSSNAEIGPGATVWGNTDPTSTSFTVSSSTSTNGETYVAYLFAHDAGGFGDSGNDNVISCGSYTGNATSYKDITLGWEPQWILVKCSSQSQADGWIVVDNLRGMNDALSAGNAWLYANTSGAETSESGRVVPTATGFKVSANAAVNTNGASYIYIAIRRGPMKTPTDATKVFTAITNTGNGNFTAGQALTTNFPVDLAYVKYRTSTFDALVDRIRGITTPLAIGTPSLCITSTNAEVTTSDFGRGDSNTSYVVGQANGQTTINYAFRRAPGFFDVVAYTGTGSSQTLSHNLGAVPELIIVKARSTTSNWRVGTNFAPSTYATGDLNNNTSWTTGVSYGSNWFSAQPTSTTFGITSSIGASSTTYIAYLFATCPGVSKVGSYTGTGNSTFNINCGFTTGARFVLIKRTDNTGDWYVWDSARGLTVFSAPYLLFNSTAAEVTNTTYINSISTGFGVSAGSPEIPVNITGASYIYLAIA